MEDTATYNLEHVMPVNPSADWNVSDETLQSSCKRLGNMAVLDPSMNADLGNKSLEVKKAIFKLSPLLTTRRIADFDTWGPEQIDIRQSEMAQDAAKVWPI